MKEDADYKYYASHRLYAAAVDIARIHILAAEGGMYVDSDIIPYDIGVAMHDVLSMQGAMLLPGKTMRDLGRGAFFFTNSIIATTKGHPIMEAMKGAVPRAIARFGYLPAWWVTGACLLTWVARGSFSVIDPLLITSTRTSRTFDEVMADLRKQSETRLILFCQFKEWAKKDQP